MKRIIFIALFLAAVPCFSQTIGYGLPQQTSAYADSLWKSQQRASFYLQKSANVELAILPVAVVGGGCSYLLFMNGEDTKLLGSIVGIGTGIASLVMWVVQNRYKHKAGTLLERVKIEQNGITIKL